MIRRLARALTKIRPHYSVVVVGSGYGGGVTASRMARAGRSVCVLERGKELHPGEYPDTPGEALFELQVSHTPLGHLGSRSALYDLRLGDDLSAFVGCGLGGTSLINANVGIRPDRRVFDEHWPAALQGGTDPELLLGYERAEAMLQPKPYPGPEPAKLQSLQRSADALGLGKRLSRPPLYVNFSEGTNHVGVEQHACNDCGDCISGCNYGAKNTVLMNYLPDAHNHGAEIFTEVRVHHIERAENGWLVAFEALDRRDTPFQWVSADIVVLAAGSLGSTEILLRSRPHLTLSSRLGERFSGNGGVIALGIGADQPVHSMGVGEHRFWRHDRVPPGPCITGVIELGPDEVGGELRVVEEGSAPGPLADLPRLLARLAPDAPPDEVHDALGHTQIYLSTCQDGSAGRLELDDEGDITIVWPGAGETAEILRTNDVLHRASDAIDATFVASPAWYADRQLVTVHPLGGCVMGDDAARGVVDDRGRVYSGSAGTDVHDGLYVADGAIVSGALAYNPSLTITALAERMCILLARDREWEFDVALPSSPTPGAGESALPTLEFSERMTGFVSTEILDDFERAADLGRAAGSSFEFQVTVIGEDVENVIADPRHECRVRGWVKAPAFDDDRMEIIDGTVRLFVPDPKRVEVRQMHYRLRCTSGEGRAFVVRGYKDLHDDPGFDVWSDTTTMYVTVYDQSEPRGPIARGVLRMSAPDFLHELRTLTVRNVADAGTRLHWIASFGRMFFGNLYRSYGKIHFESRETSPQTLLRRLPRICRRADLSTSNRAVRILDAPVPIERKLRASDRTALRLTRYQGGGKGPVLIGHAFGTSTLAFRTPTIEVNLVEFLSERGYDVWLFDYRASTELAASRTKFTLDDVALRDWPAAVAHVREETGAESVQAIAHCVGSMTLLMALLGGMGGVRSAVCSALTTHPVPNHLNHIKSQLGLTALLPLFGIDNFNTSFSGSVVDRLFEALLHIYPIPPAEHCGNPVCRRIFAIYGPSYKHAQLNDATHDALDSMFGVEHVVSFKHLTKILSVGHVVDACGNDTYLPHLDRLAIPIRFIHGAENQEFLPTTSQTAYDLLRTTNDPGLYSYDEIPHYGHMDTFIGRHASRDVFPKILKHLDAT